jgi:hypothetical protein
MKVTIPMRFLSTAVGSLTIPQFLTCGLDHGKLEFWSDAIIEITIPFGLKECEWFIDGDGTYREQNVWVTVDGVDSNEKALKVMKPETCP